MDRDDGALSGEQRLIRDFFQPIATHPGALGLTDDVGVLTPPPGCEVVLKTDAIVGAVHFAPDDPADDVARKALRVNLSDLAAKGARPLGFLLALTLPGDVTQAWLEGFAEGLRTDSVRYGCPLFGGDTDRTPGPISIAVAMFGAVPQGTLVRRSGASPGDRVFVTGTLGDAALGLALRQGASWPLSEPQRRHLASRYVLPRPRTLVADAVRSHATASIDLSDGLARDLATVCRTSEVGADIDLRRLPLSPAAAAVGALDPTALATVVAGGDDYEILCTVPAVHVDSFRTAARAVGVPVTDIGVIVTGSRPVYTGPEGRPFAAPAGFSHF